MSFAMKPLFIFLSFVLLSPVARAHHLDDYDARVRAEANLPAEWFACRFAKECDLVPVPCGSGLAINVSHLHEAREALVRAIPFCLGSSLDDTEAECKKGQCVTRGH